MVQTTEIFEHEGHRFVVEPPVKTGEHVVDSLGKLAAIAALGHEAHAEAIAQHAEQTDRMLKQLQDSSYSGIGGFPQFLTNRASRRKKHTFFLPRY